MKTTRDQLKGLVKELLLELLTEGLGNVVSQSPVNRSDSIKRSFSEQAKNKKQTFDPRLDTPVSRGRTMTDALREAVIRESGGNPVMQSILADTALTTLPTQLSRGDSMGQPGLGGPSHGSTNREQFDGEVAEVFGEAGEARSDGSSHWADLAFMSTKKSV